VAIVWLEESHLTKKGGLDEFDTKKPFGEYAMLGAWAGSQFAKEHINDHQSLLRINDYKWLEQKFKEIE
jgi:hypothetical protein